MDNYRRTSHRRRTYIALIPKSPWRKGRIGPAARQDWVSACDDAAKLAKQMPDAKIIVADAYVERGERPDLELYQAALEEAGVPKNQQHLTSEGMETIGHIEALNRIARAEDVDLLIVSTFLHYPRVRWICRGQGHQHRAAWGIPRPKEALTDLVLTILFPLLDRLGLRQQFLKRVTKRRESGEL